jgi:hypothetical protein
MDVPVTFFLNNPNRFATDILRQAEEAQLIRQASPVGSHIEVSPLGLNRWSAQEVDGDGHRWLQDEITTDKIVKAAVAVLQGAEDLNLGDGGSRDLHENLAEAFIYDDAERLGTWTADAVLQRATYGSVLFPSP